MERTETILCTQFSPVKMLTYYRVCKYTHTNSIHVEAGEKFQGFLGVRGKHFKPAEPSYCLSLAHGAVVQHLGD